MSIRGECWVHLAPEPCVMCHARALRPGDIVPVGADGILPASAAPGKVKSDGWSTSYYELPPDAREIQDLIEYRNMNFAVANIFKACYRLGQKEGIDQLYDIRKIIWYAERESARLTSIQNQTTGETKK